MARYVIVLLLLIISIVATNALPLVDPGLFVIMGVSTCRAGDGYCLLGQDCTLDEDFLPDDNGGHCEGLRNAFTPSAHFICCKYNPSNTTEPATSAIKDIYITSEAPMKVENPTVNQVLDGVSVSVLSEVVTNPSVVAPGYTLDNSKENDDEGMSEEKSTGTVDVTASSIVDEVNSVVEPIVEQYEKLEDEYDPVVEDVEDTESEVHDAKNATFVVDTKSPDPVGLIALDEIIAAPSLPDFDTLLLHSGIDAVFDYPVIPDEVDASNDWSPILPQTPPTVTTDQDDIREIELDVKIPMEQREVTDELETSGKSPIAIIASKAKESEQLNLIQRDQRISPS